MFRTASSLTWMAMVAGVAWSAFGQDLADNVRVNGNPAKGVIAKPGTSLKARRVGHVLVLNEVFLNGTGPFRMMIDTGNASSLIRPEVARRLKARAAYAVEQVTTAGVRRLPVVVLDEVRAGEITDRAVEAMIGDVRLDGLDGVLGQSWLVRHDYLLDYRNSRVVIDGAPTPGGLRMTLRSADGRPSLAADVDGRHADLVLDSGAPSLVLFESNVRVRHTATLRTNGDSAGAEEGSVRIVLAGDRERQLSIVRVNFNQPAPGLLPASAFAAVYVSNREGFAKLTW
jgi:predicted aspartyl protease